MNQQCESIRHQDCGRDLKQRTRLGEVFDRADDATTNKVDGAGFQYATAWRGAAFTHAPSLVMDI